MKRHTDTSVAAHITGGRENKVLALSGSEEIQNTLDQITVESALSLEADSHDAPAPECINSTLDRVCAQLERLVAATLRQTAIIQDSSHLIAAAIIAGHPGVNFQREAVEIAGGLADEIRYYKERMLRA